MSDSAAQKGFDVRRFHEVAASRLHPNSTCQQAAHAPTHCAIRSRRCAPKATFLDDVVDVHNRRRIATSGTRGRFKFIKEGDFDDV